MTSVIVVTKTLEAKAGSIFNFFSDTGTKIPNKPATIIFKIIEIPINKERFNSQIFCVWFTYRFHSSSVLTSSKTVFELFCINFFISDDLICLIIEWPQYK